jgi:hypothetical protein
VEIPIGASKNTCEIDDKTRIEEQIMSSQTFHQTPGGRIQEITEGVQFGLENLESFDPVTQELYRLLLAMIQYNLMIQKAEKIEVTPGSRAKRWSCYELKTKLEEPSRRSEPDLD